MKSVLNELWRGVAANIYFAYVLFDSPNEKVEVKLCINSMYEYFIKFYILSFLTKVKKNIACRQRSSSGSGTSNLFFLSWNQWNIGTILFKSYVWKSENVLASYTDHVDMSTQFLYVLTSCIFFLMIFHTLSARSFILIPTKYSGQPVYFFALTKNNGLLALTTVVPAVTISLFCDKWKQGWRIKSLPEQRLKFRK